MGRLRVVGAFCRAEETRRVHSKRLVALSISSNELEQHRKLGYAPGVAISLLDVSRDLRGDVKGGYGERSGAAGTAGGRERRLHVRAQTKRADQLRVRGPRR